MYIYAWDIDITFWGKLCILYTNWQLLLWFNTDHQSSLKQCPDFRLVKPAELTYMYLKPNGLQLCCTHRKFSSRADFSCLLTSLASSLEVGVVVGVLTREVWEGVLVGVDGTLLLFTTSVEDCTCTYPIQYHVIMVQYVCVHVYTCIFSIL